ncbi:chemotaxis protein [Photobacterium jeanii]|uniref:Chemotaxis protein n=1 Tax=Photobacterium jeanii TaxID=858640 RepID=A0A178KMT2_9GAMM|nr:methyl-accepting chemotaxis protein [Photobacterium jeanii]OAN18698.1 chemotaxis protein [Photobacterium jeanii]PST91621.1 methyl-accepting chemotaxis protein [Photobacterium jeanii]
MSITMKQKILASVLATIVIITSTLTWLAAGELFSQSRSGIYSRATSVTNVATNAINNWLANQELIIQSTAKSIDTNNLQTVMLNAKEIGGFSDIFFADMTGNLYLSGNTTPLAGFNATTRSWFKEALSSQKVVTSEPYKGTNNNQTMLTFSAPVIQNGQVIGVLGADVALSALQNTITSYDVGTNSNAMLLTNEGRILAYTNTQLVLQSLTKLAPELTINQIHSAMNEHSIQIYEDRGQEKLIYFGEIDNSNWIFAVQMDRATEEASHNQLLKNLILASVLGTIIAVVATSLIINFLFKDLVKIAGALEDIASGEGDLTQRLEPHSNDEIGQLALNFNRFVGNMHQMVMRLREVSDSLNIQANTTAEQAEERSNRIQHQQDEINMVATAINEMAAATQEIAGNADNTAQTSAETVSAADHGAQQVTQSQHSISSLAGEVETATGVIGELNTHAQSINTILSTIQGIAEQTNLLALNAAIEAARAGEQGRGFAVVADEVRVLSQRTHASTQEIQQMIETLQQTTGRAVGIMENSRHLAETSVDDANAASASLAQINNAVTNISDMATQIASAAEEQSSVTEEITRNTQGIRDVSDELAQEAGEAAQQAAELSQLSHQLQQEINRFKL